MGTGTNLSGLATYHDFVTPGRRHCSTALAGVTLGTDPRGPSSVKTHKHRTTSGSSRTHWNPASAELKNGGISWPRKSFSQ
jgi:hypothetical protein